jgi:hypothetical protein
MRQPISSNETVEKDWKLSWQDEGIHGWKGGSEKKNNNTKIKDKEVAKSVRMAVH